MGPLFVKWKKKQTLFLLLLISLILYIYLLDKNSNKPAICLCILDTEREAQETWISTLLKKKKIHYKPFKQLQNKQYNQIARHLSPFIFSHFGSKFLLISVLSILLFFGSFCFAQVKVWVNLHSTFILSHFSHLHFAFLFLHWNEHCSCRAKDEKALVFCLFIFTMNAIWMSLLIFCDFRLIICIILRK